MSGLWCEHFQNYADTAQLLDGVFAQLGDWSIASSGSVPPLRAGASWLQSSGISTGTYWRRVFGGQKTGAGFGFRYFIDALPPNDVRSNGQQAAIGGFMSASGIYQMTAFLGSDGGIVICQGGPGTGGAFTSLGSTPPVITARTWQYVELKCVPSSGAGSFEVRVNGVSVYVYTGDTDPAAAGEVSQAFAGGATEAVYAYGDLHAWDTAAGNGPSDFTGNVGVLRRELNADTATAGWTLSTGATGFSLLIDENDATYVEADTTTLKSAFQASSLPAGTAGILYQQVSFRGLKTDSADCSVAPSMISATVESAVTGQPMTSIDTWRWAIFGDDPNTSAPWTLAAANASDAAITRTL